MYLSTACILAGGLLLLAAGGAVFLGFFCGKSFTTKHRRLWTIQWLLVAVCFLAAAGLSGWMWHTETSRSPLEPPVRLFD